MKKRIKIKQTSILSIFGLSLLILLSPCKVRNFIQAELGTPQTEVSNKSQTTVSSSDCLSFEEATSPTNTHHPSHPLLADLFDVSFVNSDARVSISGVVTTSKFSAVSLYILFQNLRVYL